MSPDAVVIGAGPNGLVAANVLADAGWSVVVLEAEDEPGGAVRSGELLGPGVVVDRFSAFYPLAAVSPPLVSLRLEEYGLQWQHAPAVVANPLVDGRCALMTRDLDETASSLDQFAGGDGDRWREQLSRWGRVGDALVPALLGPYPPLLPAARVAGRLRAELLEFARFALLPVGRLGAETFAGAGGRLLLNGNATHSGLGPAVAPSGLFGWLLSCLGQTVGFPVPQGGAGQLTRALVERLNARGGRVVCRSRVTRIDVRRGRAVGVVLAGGEPVGCRRAVLADVAAPALYRQLLDPSVLPPRLFSQLARFAWDAATVKVDWLLDGAMPWTAQDARRAGTVHVADGPETYATAAGELDAGRIPDRPPVVVGQMTTTDRTRSPAGTESLWAYVHAPQQPRWDADGRAVQGWSEVDVERLADRLEAQLERFAPGFRELVRHRAVQSPLHLQAADANLVHGAIGGGSSALYQQLLFRPLPGLVPATTPIAGLYLASASAHPGGGVHGACGANAARAALVGDVRRRVVAGAAGLARRRQPQGLDEGGEPARPG